MNNPHSIKARMIKDNLMFAILELGTGRTIDLIREACKKIAAEGGTECGSPNIFLESELWERDSWVLEDIQDKLST